MVRAHGRLDVCQGKRFRAAVKYSKLGGESWVQDSDYGGMDTRDECMDHRVEVIVGQSCRSCDEAEALWCALAAELGVAIEVRRINQYGEAGPAVSALPVLQVDGRAIAVGVPSIARARLLLERALEAQ